MIPLVLDFFSFLFFFYRKFLSYLASPTNFNFNYNETYICIWYAQDKFNILGRNRFIIYLETRKNFPFNKNIYL